MRSKELFESVKKVKKINPNFYFGVGECIINRGKVLYAYPYYLKGKLQGYIFVDIKGKVIGII